jgi:PAS domain S-box-containing protein
MPEALAQQTCVARTRCVLVADGSADGRARMRALLDAATGGWRANEAATGGEVVQRVLGGEPPHCVLLDVDLPGLGAAGVLEALAGVDGLLVCPVVVLAGPESEAQGRAMLRAGAQDYVGKDWLSAPALARVLENAAERWRMARELHRREREVRLQRQRMPIGCIVYDAQFRIREWNPACEAIFGWSEAEALGQCAETLFVPPEFAARLQANRDRLRAGHPLVTSRNENLTRDGRRIVCEWHNNALFDEAGRFVGAISMVQDVTDRQRALERLDAQERFTRRITDVAPCVLYVHDLAGGTNVWGNQAMGTVLGRTPAEIVALGDRVVPALMHPDDLPRFRAHCDRLAAIGEGEVASFEYRMRHADGRWLWLHSRDMAYARDAEGRVRQIIGAALDITGRKQAEQDLQRALERAEVAQQAAEAALYEYHPREDRSLRAEAFRDLLGWAPHEIAPTLAGWLALVHPEDTPVQEQVAQALRQGDGFDVQYRMRHKDGRWLWVADRARVVRDADGTALRVTGMVVDISATKQVEQELRAAQALLQAVIDGSPTLVYAKDLQGRYFLANRAWLRVTGLERLPPGGIDDAALFPPALAGQVRANDTRCLVAGEPLVVEESGHIGGGWRTYLSSKFPLRDESGRATAVCGVSIDITELKRVQQALQARERELQTLADNTPDILVRYDRAHRHTYVNAALERLQPGLRRSEFIGRTAREIGMAAEDAARWEQLLDEVFATGSPRAMEFAFGRVGRRRHYAAELVPEFGDDGAVRQVLAVLHDHTAVEAGRRALAEEARRKNEFLAMLAHELRNPLAPLRNGVEILERGGSAPPLARVLPMMRRQLSHLVHLVDDLLDLSRISRGQVQLRRERIVLQAACAVAVEAVRPQLEARRQPLLLDLPDEPLWAEADPTRVGQMVTNLLSNASRYSPEGSAVRLALSAGDGQALLQVADQGRGIPPEMLERIFEMFVQVRDGGPPQGGLGIGLALVRQLAAMHGGSVAATSPGPGLGSTFTLALPLAPAPWPLQEEAAPEADRRRWRVLLAGLAEADAQALAAGLREGGHAVETVDDGMEALAAAVAAPPDVLVLDLALPGLPAAELARQLRALPEGARLRVVGLTGWTAQEDRSRAHAAGCDVHLARPVDPRTLGALMAAWEAGGG